MRLPHQDLAHVLKHMRAWEKLRGKRIFLTGASGFAGTWLSESFEFANAQLGLDAGLTKVSRTVLPEGEFDFGIHAAKADTFPADMDATRRSLDFAAQRGVSRLLFTSSGAVYGKMPAGETRFSEDYPCAPESDYACAKYEGEQLCGQYRFCAVIARMFAFVGPGLPLNANFAAGNFIRDVLNGGPLMVQGDGTARRSYLYAADLAVWLWTLLLEGEHARPYNVGSREGISILDLARTVVANTRPDTSIVVKGGACSSVYVPSVDRAKSELGLRPLVALEEGIRRMYAWNKGLKDREMGLAPATNP